MKEKEMKEVIKELVKSNLLLTIMADAHQDILKNHEKRIKNLEEIYGMGKPKTCA